MCNKGQASSFMIIGLTIVIMLGLLTFWMSASQEGSLGSNDLMTFNQKLEIVKNTVEQCMQEAGEPGLYKIAAQGGMIDKDGRDSIEYKDFKILYWNNGKRDISPSLEEIEKELSEYIFEKTIDCLPDYVSEGYIVDFQSADLIAIIDDEDVKISLYLPIEVKAADTSGKVSSFNIELNNNFGKSLNAAYLLIKNIVDSNNLFSISKICDHFQINEVSRILPITFIGQPLNKVQIISIIDYEPYFKERQKVLTLNFALRNMTVIGYCNDI